MLLTVHFHIIEVNVFVLIIPIKIRFAFVSGYISIKAQVLCVLFFFKVRNTCIIT